VPAAASTDAAPAPPAWSEVPVAPRLSSFGPLARAVHEGLGRARDALEPCYAADARSRAGQRARVPASDELGSAVVMLEIESRDGALEIVALPLQELGGSSQELVACCEDVLRGFRFVAPGAAPGRRYRLPYQLTP
ncbi:MAG TPA: hypothetical protein VFP65_21185, partial [Anaeromyxobacteraceae bacterium]|nr:hypothetical protein [Anaeromyxobacteraceae bacterium]